MTNIYLGIKIFNPMFSYQRSASCWKQLGSFLKIYGALHDEETAAPYPAQTAYYLYKDNIAVILERNGVYYCQTYSNGEPQRLYEIINEADELEKFFDDCGDNLTVLENERACELPPKFKDVLAYAQSFKKARDISDKHKDTVTKYAIALNEFRNQCEDLSSSIDSSTYKDALYVADQFYIVLGSMVNDICSQALCPARKLIIDDEANLYRTFGLFVYALSIGIRRGRFIRRHKEVINTAFSGALEEMHQFMQDHPDIEEEYCEYMNLAKNERENLRALLEEEGFYNNNWGYIGNSLF